MTFTSVSMLSEDCVDSDNNFSTIEELVLQKRNCKMSSKLMLRHRRCENMKRTKKFRQPTTLTGCQNSPKTTLKILSIFFIFFTLSGKQSIFILSISFEFFAMIPIVLFILDLKFLIHLASYIIFTLFFLSIHDNVLTYSML